jgi:peroxiredoxin
VINKRYMSKNKRNSAFPLIFIGSGLIFLAFTGVIFVNRSSGATEPSADETSSVIPVQVDYPAPELVRVDLNGNPASLDEYGDKVVLVNNWATWCPPCRAEMPELETYYQAHAAEAFTLIGISAGDSAEQVQRFVLQNGLSFPMWLDPDSAALRAFRNDALPSSYVIDKSGTVRLAWTGAISLEMLEKHVTPLLSE